MLACFPQFIKSCPLRNLESSSDDGADDLEFSELDSDYGISCSESVAKPAQLFDLTSWKLQLPEFDPVLGKAQEIDEFSLSTAPVPFSHPQWFYIDGESNKLVFCAPNHLATTRNSVNTRSELREMIRSGNKRIKTKSPSNNWVLAAHSNASQYGAVGGRLQATLSVDWVSTSGDDKKLHAYSVVLSQIHGSGKTEPLKIFYRKLPHHDHGSLFWNYESRPANENERIDVSHDIFGMHRLRITDSDPEDGIALGETFSYDIHVTGNIMRLKFWKDDDNIKSFTHDLSVGQSGIPNDRGYSTDWLYFKAGAYNQCNLSNGGIGGSACSNRGKEAGDYVQASFDKLSVTH